jgi:hypothetical protein
MSDSGAGNCGRNFKSIATLTYGLRTRTLLHGVSCGPGSRFRADSHPIPEYHARFRLPRDCAILVRCVLLTEMEDLEPLV